MIHPTNATWNENGGWYIQQEDVQINNAVPIPAPPYSVEGYTFLGWGRVCDPDTVPEGGRAYVTDPSTLTEEDLYIKWVPEQTVDGVTTAAHYEAQMPPRPDALSQDYYLVGWINGADDNNGANVFDKSTGRLSVIFTEKSYVAVKAPNGQWFKMYNGDFADWTEAPESGSANLYFASNNNDQKLPVPAGVQVNFTLRELRNSDGIYGVELSYTTGVAPAGNVVPSNLRAGDGEELTWQTVQYVAADEEKPYHDMYAIWGGEFYVYHSGVAGGAIETVPLTRANATYDLTRNLGGEPNRAGEKPNVLYGGYYIEKEGGFAPPAAVDGVIPAYDGTNWTWLGGETQNGMEITPRSGVTYYIKEVPADKYLQPYFHYTYKKDIGDEPIVTAWLISDLDDQNYTESGFVIVDANGKAKICSSLTVQTAVGGNTIKLTPKRVFGVGNSGLLTYRRVIENYAGIDGFGDNAAILQYWVTPDGLIVTGTTSRVYTGTAAKANVGCTPTAVGSTIALFGNNSLPVPDPDAY